ncbi:MAG: hypothetical protein LLG02_09030 [Pelosinus sp.]|nr:hypothetical protein [Pelosinus sp.]
MEQMLDIYHTNYPLYEDFTNQMQQFVSAILQKNNIRVQSVMARVKTAASLRQKIVSHNKYTELDDITDLCGLRIITYFEDDVDQIADLLQERLAIDKENSIDKRKLLAPNQFGYLSLHLVASLPAPLLQVPQYIKFKNCKIEIQICSILQHAWAEIEHDLGYKASTALSYSARRSFSRLAGLLEIADGEFSQLRAQLQPALVTKPKLAPALGLHEALPQKSFTLLQQKTASLKRKTVSLVKSMNGYQPLRIAAGNPLLCIMLLVFTVYCAIDATHLSSSLLLALKTEKHTLFALACSHLHV